MGAKELLGSIAVAGSLMWASSAYPATISIGLAEGGPVSLVSSGTDAAAFVGAFGTFSTNIVSGTAGVFPDLLGSTTSNLVTATPGTIDVVVTAQGLTSPTSAFSSFLTSNTLPAGWSVTEQTFVDTANGRFTTTPGGTVTQLASNTFNDIGTSVQGKGGVPSGSMYSITELYILTSTGAGGPALSTIDVQANPVPLPATLPLLGSGLLGLWAWGRKRRAASRDQQPATA
jgi:hypothetical protein